MTVKEHVSLREYNTFGLDASARFLVTVLSESDITEILQENIQPMMILGGGSNILFADDYPGLVIENKILGREILDEDTTSVRVRLGAGENWHQVVLWAIENGWGGIENLSLIPGTVGAAPMQNIGAYGVELSSVFSSLEAINLTTGESRVFEASDCDFGYRYSVFKGPAKGQYLITRVTLKLQKDPVFNTSYGAVANTLKEMGVTKLSLKDVSNAIIKIRQSKLPDPNDIGNAGSFFKNPTVPKEFFNNLKTEYTNIPSYPTEDNLIKIPAGWLIEQCNWKGFRDGDIGVHKQQALVLVNYGNAKGRDLLKLSVDIQDSVFQKFGIKLSPEVNVVPGQEGII